MRQSVPRAAAVVTAVLAAGCAAMALAHAGVTLPLLSAIGPGGARVIMPAVIAFTTAAAVLAVLAVALWRGRAWGWALGVVVHALVIYGAAVPYRGLASLLAIILGGSAIALLLTPPGRRGLLENAA